jgi:maltooligosyltrehalose trehalohydrolase
VSRAAWEPRPGAVQANASYWVDEFHLDRVRLDATQDVEDESGDHILAEVVLEVRRAAGGRTTVVPCRE